MLSFMVENVRIPSVPYLPKAKRKKSFPTEYGKYVVGFIFLPLQEPGVLIEGQPI